MNGDDGRRKNKYKKKLWNYSKKKKIIYKNKLVGKKKI